jgi:hypothetical protein
VVDLRQTTADHISRLDQACFPDPHVGALFFSIFQAAEQHSSEYLSSFQRLDIFDT